MSFEVSEDWWKALFDEVYLLTDARSVDDAELTRCEVDLLCQLLPLRPADRILDLCGGQGRHSLELAARGFSDCTVFDYSQVLLDRGRAEADNREIQVEFLQGEAHATGLGEGCFDCVLVLGNSLGYLPHDQDDLRILQEARRVLRPGGWLLLDVTDGQTVRERFNPNAWHEIEPDIVVCRQRQLDGRTIRCREVVLCKQRGLIRDQTYAVRTYSSVELQALVEAAKFGGVSVRNGFGKRSEAGDYGFMNHRLVLLAQRPG